MSDMKITAVIPALNEADTIGGVIRGLKPYVSEIVLVDDGSKDDTAVLARNAGAHVVSHSACQGYDKSIDDGFAEAVKRGAAILFTFDADGQHAVSDVPGMIEPVLNGTADVVVGRRPYTARITEYLFSFVSRRLAGIDDPLCGFKVYSAAVYRAVGYFDKIGSIGTQLMFNAKKKGFRLTQKKIQLSSRADTPRFGRVVKANWKIFKAILKTIYYANSN